MVRRLPSPSPLPRLYHCSTPCPHACASCEPTACLQSDGTERPPKTICPPAVRPVRVHRALQYSYEYRSRKERRRRHRRIRNSASAAAAGTVDRRERQISPVRLHCRPVPAEHTHFHRYHTGRSEPTRGHSSISNSAAAATAATSRDRPWALNLPQRLASAAMRRRL